jgi:CDP-diglyceride synthetase
MVERIDSAPRVSPRRSFAMGALWGLVAAGFVFPVLAVFNREMYPAQAQAMVVYAAAICLASAVGPSGFRVAPKPAEGTRC